MNSRAATSLYRHAGAALLRSAVSPATDAPDWWPDPSDTRACRLWLEQVWCRAHLADAMRQASPILAHRVDAIRAGRPAEAKRIRRATLATARYLLRATGRPTPFGLFAGVVPVGFGRTVEAQWGPAHRPVARADTQWLADVVERLEACVELLDRLDVVFTNVALRRGEWLEAPHGPNRVRIRYTSAVHAVVNAARVPVRFSALADLLSDTFATADRSAVHRMLIELVQQRFLITCLRAPLTTIDPLTHLADQLSRAGADTLPSVAPILRDLQHVRAEVSSHNHQASVVERGRRRDALTCRMRQISQAGRSPLAMDLMLDCHVQVPEHVAHEMERAASAMLRLTRQPAGLSAWRQYHAAFCDRYGTGTLIPLTEVIDPDAGLGYPAGYPGSMLSVPTEAFSERDNRLLALAWQVVTDGSTEVVLSEDTIRTLASNGRPDDHYVPPHVELAACIQAPSAEALDRGEYTLIVAPARAGGVLTSRFTPNTTGSGWEEVYGALPVAIHNALPAQLSFPPAYSHAENICRIPAYLPHVLSLGEHRRAGDNEALIPPSDLAVTATRDRLHLISISRRTVVEPQVFHALALDKQAPPLARFLAHLPRAFMSAWTMLNWGPYAEQLPYLPRVRYRRSILAPARWRLTTDDLPGDKAGHDIWREALDRWRRRWRCPGKVELRNDDRALRLNLDEPIHAAILHAHLKRHGHAILTEVAAECGWLDGHAHQVVLPLVRTCTAAPSPVVGCRPVVTNGGHGELPGDAGAKWLYAKIHSHRERQDELIADHLPALSIALGADTEYWFVRYHSPYETDHLRLRLRIPHPEQYGAYATAVGAWARELRNNRTASRLVLDTYQPEIGRYGHGLAMDAAEAVFVADSWVVAARLRHLPGEVDRTALAVANMLDIVSAFLGPDQAMAWLAARPAPGLTATDRTVSHQAMRAVPQSLLTGAPSWPREVAGAWQRRSTALAAYRKQLPADADTDTVIESLLHMHYNRAVGIDPDGERTCRRLARQAALAWQARRAGTDH